MTHISTKQDLILDFIKQFRDLGATDCFSNGMCYWFAAILRMRFHGEHCHMMYDEVANHFGCEINSRTYDITGDVTGKYNWESWYNIEMRDRLLYNRILRDCKDKIPAGVRVGNYCEHGYDDDWGHFICDKDNHPCGWNEPCVFKEDV